MKNENQNKGVKNFSPREENNFTASGKNFQDEGEDYSENEEKNQPAFYAIIPALVRYDNDIPAGAKLLYGEITALCNKKGYCWAKNSYFAQLYETSERTIINWIKALRDKGHISVSLEYVLFPNGVRIKSRYIRLAKPAYNKTVKNSSSREENNFTASGKNFPDEVKNFSESEEKNCVDNTTNNIKNNTSSAEPPETTAEPSPNNEKAEAGFLSQKDLRDTLTVLDRRLSVLDENFYSRAPAFMFENNLPLDYLSWLREKIENSEYRSFAGKFFDLFFRENIVRTYKISLSPEIKPPPPEIKIVCPVCGESHAESDDSCPSCRLPKDSKKETVLLFRELQKLPPEKREEYLRREDEIANEFGFKDLTKSMEALAALKQEFGLSS